MIDLSRATRNTDPSNLKDIPGPGYYSSPAPKQIGSYVFGRSERTVSDFSSSKYEDIPGPGAYSVANNSSATSARTPFNSSSARFSSFDCSWKLGPGFYYKTTQPIKPNKKIVQTLCIHPSPVPCSIPLLERHELAVYDGDENRVSPAEYYPTFSQIKPRPPASLFSKSKKPRVLDKTPGYENIGPGSYAIEATGRSIISKNINYSERFSDQKHFTPGPGYYNPNISAIKPKQSKFFVSNLQRNFNLAKKVTQEYPVKEKKTMERISPNAVFASSSQRDCNRVAPDSPVGPGYYEVLVNKKEGFSFREEPRFKNKEESPIGPGSYNPAEVSKKGSPISYKTNRFRELSDPYVHLIGDKITPGPGDYETSRHSNTHKGISFDLTSGRYSDRKRDHSPDPGQYYNNYNYAGGHKIGNQHRFKPGPGNYIQPSGSTEFVGPGTYKDKTSMIKRTHNITWI